MFAWYPDVCLRATRDCRCWGGKCGRALALPWWCSHWQELEEQRMKEEEQQREEWEEGQGEQGGGAQ